MENKKIVDYLLGCGIRPNLKGFKHLYEAISLTIKNKYELPQVTKCLYPTIAEKYNDTPSRVERAIRTCIQTAKKELRTKSNSEFIATAALSLKFAR